MEWNGKIKYPKPLLIYIYIYIFSLHICFFKNQQFGTVFFFLFAYFSCRCAAHDFANYFFQNLWLLVALVLSPICNFSLIFLQFVPLFLTILQVAISKRYAVYLFFCLFNFVPSFPQMRATFLHKFVAKKHQK